MEAKYPHHGLSSQTDEDFVSFFSRDWFFPVVSFKFGFFGFDDIVNEGSDPHSDCFEFWCERKVNGHVASSYMWNSLFPLDHQ